MFGYNLNTIKIEKVIKNLSLRGRDGYGIVAINSETGKSIESKKLDNINTQSFAPINYNLIIGNSRATPSVEFETGAGFDKINLQPFSNDKYIVVLNGVISNDMKLREKYNIKTESKVDTSILPPLFSKVGVVEGMKELEGGFSILCYDKENHKIFISKNFTPLRYYYKKQNKEGKSELLFISLKEMTEGLYETKEVKPYSIYEIDLNNIDVWKVHSLYKRKSNKKVLVILSGGADSTTVVYLYKYLGYDVSLLHFKYSQAAQETEVWAVKKISEKLHIPLYIYDAQYMFRPFKEVTKLLHQKEADESRKLEDAETTYISYVPNRNAIMSMIGAAYAEMLECDTLSFGGNQEDGGVYPDNAIPYLKAVNQTLKYSLNWFTNIKFTAPLINLIKHEVIALGKELEIDFEEVVSCYYPKIIDNKLIRCHKCGCCVYIDNALKMNKEKEVIKKGELDDWINKYIKNYI